jgi:hypothetical protein
MHQAKYTKDLMKKFNMEELKPISTLMSTAMLLGPDEDGEVVSYPVFMPKPSTHRMHDPGSNVPHIRPKGFTENQMP